MGPLDTLPGRVLGAKPAPVCRWIFALLGACPGDTLDDLFPGSGAVSRAWAAFTRSPDPSPKSRVDASLTAAGDACDRGALVLVASSPGPSCSPVSDASSKAWPYPSSGPQLYASPKVAVLVVLSGSGRGSPRSTTRAGTWRARSRLRRDTTSFEFAYPACLDSITRLPSGQRHSAHIPDHGHPRPPTFRFPADLPTVA